MDIENRIKLADETIKNQKSIDWFGFSMSFLFLAVYGCNRMQSDPKTNKLEIIAVLYNIKHSLEIILKYFAKIIDFDIENSHNIKLLFGKLKDKCRNKIAKDESVFFENLNELEIIIRKFYHLEVLQKHINDSGDFFLEDSMNTFLRYPENNKVDITFAYYRIIKRVDEKDIAEILADVSQIMNFFTYFEKRLKQTNIAKILDITQKGVEELKNENEIKDSKIPNC